MTVLPPTNLATLWQSPIHFYKQHKHHALDVLSWRRGKQSLHPQGLFGNLQKIAIILDDLYLTSSFIHLLAERGQGGHPYQQRTPCSLQSWRQVQQRENHWQEEIQPPPHSGTFRVQNDFFTVESTRNVFYLSLFFLSNPLSSFKLWSGYWTCVYSLYVEGHGRTQNFMSLNLCQALFIFLVPRIMYGKKLSSS